MRIASLLIFCCFGWQTLSAQVENYSAGLNGQKLDWLLFYLDEHYVDRVWPDSLADVAIMAITKQLDPYSVYHSKEEVERQNNSDNGYSGKGYGFNYYFLKDTAYIVHVSDKGPADLAGLKRGDLLMKLDTERAQTLKHQGVRDILDDVSKESIALEVVRKGKTLTLPITKALIPKKSVDAAYMLTQDAGYIKIGSFTMNSLDEFKGSLKYLKSLGMQSLVLDLRDNVGGVKDQALYIADEFLEAGKQVYSAWGQNKEKEEYISTSGGGWERGKLAVLQNAKSASASEILLGALQDWDRAVIMGVSTYGKGLIQQSYKLGDGSNIRMTVGRYFTPNGRFIQRMSDYEGDWLATYKKELDVNSLTSKLVVPADLIHSSKNGRQILSGKGGIIPDVYYVFQSKEDRTLQNDLNNDGILYNFATSYANKNRDQLALNYNTVTEFMKDRMFEAFMLQDLRKTINDLNVGYVLPKNFPDAISYQVKTWMASQLWHDNAYWEAENADDRLIWRAIEAVQGKVHDIIGIGY